MLKKISLSVMTCTYLFAGLARYIKTDYFLALVPSFIPQARAFVLLSGASQIFLGALLPFPKTRRAGCYGIILLWAIFLPLNAYEVYRGPGATPYTSLQLAFLIPFHLVLMAWAFWHSQPDLSFRTLSRRAKKS